MSYHMEALFSVIRREIERTMGKLHKLPRMGLVSSYDKKNHAVKVKFQPSGTESGWIPLTGFAVGNQWGILSAPNINDQVEVHFYGGEHMVARIMNRHFSTKNKPPQIEAGEHQFTHSSGSTMYFQKDGTVLIGGGQTMQTGQYADGKSGNISTGQNTGETGQSQQQQQNNPPNAKQTITLKPDGTMIIDVPNNNYILNVHGNQIQESAQTIILTSSDIRLGGSGAGNHVSMLGTVDTGGFVDIANLSTTTTTE